MIRSVLFVLTFIIPALCVAQKTNNDTSHVDILPIPSVNIAQFIAENLKYPERAKKNDIEGRVIAKFHIDTDGSIDSVTTLTNLGYGLEEEVIRVLSMMPNFTPGTSDGEPTKFSFTQPVVFRLESERRRFKKTKSFKEVMEDIQMSNYLLQGIKVAKTEQYIEIKEDQSFYQYKSKKKDRYYAHAGKGVYKLVLTSAHGDFFMSESAPFYLGTEEVGGIFRAFDQPDELLLWSTRLESREKALKNFKDQNYVDLIVNAPTIIRFFIDHDYVIVKEAFVNQN